MSRPLQVVWLRLYRILAAIDPLLCRSAEGKPQALRMSKTRPNSELARQKLVVAATGDGHVREMSDVGRTVS